MSRTSGFSRTRLERLSKMVQGYVERREVAGALTLLSRHDEVHVDLFGALSLDAGAKPIQRDTIFRIASMTKPVTAVAAMMLVEEGKLRLDEPLERLLPELANRQVLRRIDGPTDETAPARRSLTMRDLLTFRMGFGLLLGGRYPIHAAMDEAGIQIGPQVVSTRTPDQWLAAFAKLPLMREPGESWMYHTGADLLGVLIARASGKRFEDFLRERIFEPLGMKDTSFFVPESKMDRFATGYLPDAKTGKLSVSDVPRTGVWSKAPMFPSGGGGLVSTADDYLAFAKMLLACGRAGKDRLLARPTVALMTEDQLTSEQKASSPFTPGFWEARGWGFGMAVITKRNGVGVSPGRYGWDGGYGTTWGNDPKEDVVALLLTQRLANPIVADLHNDFWTLAYQALED